MSGTQETLIPVANTEALGLGVGRRTIGRKIKDPDSGFPPVIRINGRLYVRQADLDAYKSNLIAGALSLPSQNHAAQTQAA